MRQNESATCAALAALYFSGTFLSADLYCAPVGVHQMARRVAQGRLVAEQDRPKLLSFGVQRKTGKNEITVALEFAPFEKDAVSRIRVEIAFGDGPWRFVKAVAPSRTTLEISVKQQDEEREISVGEEEKMANLSLVVSARRGTVPAGSIAELHFALEEAVAGESIPLSIQDWQITLRDEPPSRHPPMLEPPSSDTGMNPSTNCFFFAH